MKLSTSLVVAWVARVATRGARGCGSSSAWRGGALARTCAQAVIASLVASLALADWDSTPLTCFIATSWTSPNAATQTAIGSAEETNVGGEAVTGVGGFVFSGSSDTRIECVFNVPIDYDTDAVDPPYFTLTGWAVDTDACLVSCPSDKTVRLEVSSRIFGENYQLDDAWTNEVDADFQIPGVGSNPKLYKEDTLHIVQSLPATADAGDWSEFRTVYFKIERDTNVTNNMPENFYLATVTLNYLMD